MDTQQERLSRLNHALLSGEDVCSSEGMLHDFPESLKKPFQVNGVRIFRPKRMRLSLFPVVLSFRLPVSRKMRKFLFLSTRQIRYVTL